jgi:hypothetical protein
MTTDAYQRRAGYVPAGTVRRTLAPSTAGCLASDLPKRPEGVETPPFSYYI